MTLDFSAKPAKRSLGQNFLVDKNIARKIVSLLEIDKRDTVIEIGPGRGALTGHVLEKSPALFIALEKDADLAFELKKTRPELQAVIADGLEFPWESAPASRPLKLVGNLPYNVASPLMWEIFSRCRALARAVFMVQKEVGLRLAADPGTKTYGGLTVWVKSFVRPRLAFTVRPQVFRPRPKVDSAVLVFDRINRPDSGFDKQALSGLIKYCFQRRRKQLKTILRDYWTDEIDLAARGLGIEPTMRPEELSPDRFQSLSNLIKIRFPA